MKFRTYLFYILALAITVPFIVLSFTQYLMIKQEIEKEQAIVQENAQVLVNNLKNRVDTATGLVAMAANVLRMDGIDNVSRLNRVLSYLRDSMPEFLNVHYDSPEGFSVAFDPPRNSKGESNVGQDHTGRAHWQHIKDNEHTYISDVLKGVGATTEKIINIAAPAITKDGKILGYAVSALNLKTLSRRILEGVASNDYVIWVLDSQGKPIYANDRDDLDSAVLPRSTIQGYLNSKVSHHLITRDSGSDLVGVIQPIRELGWVVGCFRRAQDQDAAIFSMFMTNTVIFLLVLLVTFLIAVLASNRLTRDLNILVNQIKNGRTRPGQDEKIKSPEELVELQKAYFTMAGKLRATQSELDKLQSSSNSELARKTELYKEQQQMMSSLVNASSAGIVVTDANGYIRFINPAAHKMLKGANVGMRLLPVLAEEYESPLPQEEWVTRNSVGLKSILGANFIRLQRVELPGLDYERVAYIIRSRMEH